jgi:hypothetical protein
VTTPTTPAAEPTHGCLRCGAPIPLSASLCAACNPAGLAQPAASQAHGTVYAGVALAVVALALAAAFLVGGVGPFRASIASVVPADGGLLVTLEVRNDGSREGQATCRVWDPTYLKNPPIETFVRTPPVPAGGTRTVEQQVTALGAEVRQFAVDCSR